MTTPVEAEKKSAARAEPGSQKPLPDAKCQEPGPGVTTRLGFNFWDLR